MSGTHYLIRRGSLCTVSRFAFAEFVFLVVFLTGCDFRITGDEYRERKLTQPALAIPASPSAQDAARFFAGMEGRPNGPFRKLEEKSAWFWHHKSSDKMWATAENEHFPALRRFQRKELAGKPFGSGIVFYPFGGPDILTAYTLFPYNSTYVLVGLEPPGTVPDVAAVETANLGKYLPRVRLMMDSLPRRSFFITEYMNHQVRGQISDGLCLPLLVQLARMNAEIVGHATISIDKNGEVVSRQDGHALDSRMRNDGIAVEFKLPGDSVPRRLFYFSVNLNDEHFTVNASFRAYLKRLSPYLTFFKSASYLPHRNDFATIRHEVLENSTSIVQDDTGVPYRFIDPRRWNVKLYGRYTQPYGSFRHLVQPDLKRAYAEGQVIPLAFYMGYGYKRAPSVLLVSTRKD